MNKFVVVIASIFLAAGTLSAQEVPKEELYLGYSFFRVNAATGIPAFTANGGQGAFQYNLTKNLGLAAEFGGYHNGKIGYFDLDSTATSVLGGPRVFFHKGGRLSPFGETLFGSMNYRRSFRIPPALTNPPGVQSARFANSQRAFGMAVGGGLDLKMSQHVVFRPIQLDYFLTRFQPLFIAGLGTLNRDRNQNNLRYSTGFNFTFGGAPPIPPTASCTGPQGNFLPDDPPLPVSVKAADFNPKHQLAYHWTTSGGKVVENGDNAKVDISGLSPGSYTVTAEVTDPKVKKLNSASCTASFAVRQPQSPSVNCSATPTSALAGEPVTINVQGASPDNRPIKSREFKASSGALTEGETAKGANPGEFSSTATLNTTGAQPGPLSVTYGVTDVRGLSGTCVAQVSIQSPPPPPVKAESTLLSECTFNNPGKPARVDNECKATLDTVALKLQQEANGKLVVVGYADNEEEANVRDVRELRAVNTKQYLTTGEGHQTIPAGRIEVRSAPGPGKRAQFYFVPEGGTFNLSETSIVDESRVQPNNNIRPVKRRKASGAGPSE